MLDTGFEINLTLRSVVDELQLPIHPFPDAEVNYNGSGALAISESVQPTWRLAAKSKWYREFRFGIVEALPSNVSMIIGHEATAGLGFFRANPEIW